MVAGCFKKHHFYNWKERIKTKSFCFPISSIEIVYCKLCVKTRKLNNYIFKFSHQTETIPRDEKPKLLILVIK